MGSSAEGNGNPLQCSCLENPMDGGAWQAAVPGVTQSQTRLKQLSSSSSTINWLSPTAVSLLSCSFSALLFSVLFLSALMHVTKPCSSHSISSGVLSSEKLSCISSRCFWIQPHSSMATFTAQHDTCHLVLEVAAQ